MVVFCKPRPYRNIRQVNLPTTLRILLYLFFQCAEKRGCRTASKTIQIPLYFCFSAVHLYQLLQTASVELSGNFPVIYFPPSSLRLFPLPPLAQRSAFGAAPIFLWAQAAYLRVATTRTHIFLSSPCRHPTRHANNNNARLLFSYANHPKLIVNFTGPVAKRRNHGSRLFQVVR